MPTEIFGDISNTAILTFYGILSKLYSLAKFAVSTELQIQANLYEKMDLLCFASIHDKLWVLIALLPDSRSFNLVEMAHLKPAASVFRITYINTTK